jgi:hypothetical protein
VTVGTVSRSKTPPAPPVWCRTVVRSAPARPARDGWIEAALDAAKELDARVRAAKRAPMQPDTKADRDRNARQAALLDAAINTKD